MKYVSSFAIFWPWPEVVRSWRRDVLWIRCHRLRQPKIRRVGRKMEFWWKSGERHDKAVNLHEVEVPVRKTFSFQQKWRCLIFLVGFFRSFGSGDEKGIDFYQRGCLRLWCFQSSVLEVAKKYIIAESSCLRQWRYGVFSEEVWSSQRKGKTGRFFFSLSSKADRHFIGREKHHYEFFLPDVSKLFTVVSNQAFSILLMIFLSCPTWRRYCRGLRRLHESFSFLGKDQRTVTVTKF